MDYKIYFSFFNINNLIFNYTNIIILVNLFIGKNNEVSKIINKWISFSTSEGNIFFLFQLLFLLNKICLKTKCIIIVFKLINYFIFRYKSLNFLILN